MGGAAQPIRLIPYTIIPPQRTWERIEVRFIKMAAELLAKANTLTEPQQRRVAAILGALVADAAGTYIRLQLGKSPALKTNMVNSTGRIIGSLMRIYPRYARTHSCDQVPRAVRAPDFSTSRSAAELKSVMPCETNGVRS